MAKMTRRQALLGFCTIAGAAAVQQCAKNPVTGRREFMLMSESGEISIGRNYHDDIVRQFGVYDNSEAQKWVSDLGVEMGKITERPNLPWTFVVLNSPVVNAFALPGGYIYFTRGIMAYFNSEAQFAGVLGHEIAHVTARHSAAQYSKSQLANLGIAIGEVISPQFQRYSPLASVGLGLMFLRYSRDNERQADSLGVKYSSMMGYDAKEKSAFFHTLERLNPAGGAIPSWMSTHPDPGDRVNDVARAADRYQQANPGRYIVNRDEYLRLVDGFVYGEDPREGYVEDNVFYHPILKLRFPIPSNWSFENMPSEVRMAPKGGEAIIVFNIVQGSSVADAANRFTEAQKIQVTERSTSVVSGMNFLNVIGKISNGSSEIGISSFYAELGGRFYGFHGLSDLNRLGQYQATFQSTAHNLRLLTDQSKINVSPRRVTIRKAPVSGSLGSSLARLGLEDKKKAESCAILNGLELEGNIASGTPLKIVSG